VLFVLAGVEGPVCGDQVDGDQSAVHDDVGVHCRVRVPDRLAEFAGAGGQQSDAAKLAHIGRTGSFGH
jgi:hypothetical protein